MHEDTYHKSFNGQLVDDNLFKLCFVDDSVFVLVEIFYYVLSFCEVARFLSCHRVRIRQELLHLFYIDCAVFVQVVLGEQIVDDFTQCIPVHVGQLYNF